MIKTTKLIFYLFLIFNLLSISFLSAQEIRINKKGYFEKHGFNVIVLNDIYPEGHQGGITLIQHGKRIATNGNISLQPTPGQWQPYPKLLDKQVLYNENKIIATLKFPDSTRIKTNEQPIIYPDFEFTYKVNVFSEKGNIKIIVDLEKPLPKEWIGKVGFNLEFYPGTLFGKSYNIDGKTGIFPAYAHSSVNLDKDGEFEAVPFAEGNELVIAPENDLQRIKIISKNSTLQLIDGRVKHNNGWFVVRSILPGNVTDNAIEWTVKPNVEKDWKYGPVIHTSQVGYHPNQPKVAVIELDKNESDFRKVIIKKVDPEEGLKTVLTIEPKKCEDFLRYKYLKADFSNIKEPGIYVVQYDDKISSQFKIDDDVYKNGVWQQTLEYYLPVQMCHLKVFEKYRVWHDQCHLDDALMAPENINHFDVYTHGKVPDNFTPLKHVKGLNKGGWHDAGDYDFRIESHIGTIISLAYAYEEFNVIHDQTLVDQENGIVEIHHPDGKPDILQQLEHGLLTVLGGYRQFGQLYRGILCPTLRQYAMLGEGADMTDNKIFEGEVKNIYEGFWYDQIETKYDKNFTPQKNKVSKKEYVKDLDDRMVFLEENPRRQIDGVAGLAASARVLKGYNDEMADECLTTAEELWNKYYKVKGSGTTIVKIHALVELILTTNKQEYKDQLVSMYPAISKNINSAGWMLGRVMKKIQNKKFIDAINKDMLKVKETISKASNENPFGIPYRPNIWGAGWGIQYFGFKHYFLYTGWPDLFSKEPMLSALNFVLGCHPGQNTNSFVSNVGTKSQLIAYGFNRAENSFIPGGVISGTNLVRPDLPELLDWPYLWQQSEYCMGGGATHFMFLALAADKLLESK